MDYLTLHIGKFLAENVDTGNWTKRPAPPEPEYDKDRIAKLLEEVGELMMAEGDNIDEELADCFMILHAIAYANKVNVEHAIHEKISSLKDRWKHEHN